jgi:hypothetical protein
MRGAFCPRGSATSIPCPAGTWSSSDNLKSEDECIDCPQGHDCPRGSSAPEKCEAGRFGATQGLASRECTGLCRSGHYCTEGSASSTAGTCPSGTYNADTGGPSKAACIPCPASIDSVNGSAACTVCAAHYYRPRADSPVSKCSLCSAIPGVRCAFNTTVETLVIERDHWRASPFTSKTYMCQTDSSLPTSCAGGGTYGDSLCLPGQSGPLCKTCELKDQYYDEGICTDCPKAGSRIAIMTALGFCGLLLVIGLYWLHEQHAPKYDAVSVPLRRCVHKANEWERTIGLVCKFKVAVTFSQVIACLDTTYDLEMPSSWYEWVPHLDLNPAAVCTSYPRISHPCLPSMIADTPSSCDWGD